VNDQLSSDLASLKIDREARSGAGGGGSSAVKKGVIALVVLGAIGAAGFLGWQKVEAQVFKQEMKTSEVALISPSQAEVTVTATGYVIPQRTSKVGAKLPGRLAKVLIKEGDDVKEGDVIAQLDDADAKTQIVAAGSRVGVAQARVQTARAQLAEITQQVAREKSLVASGAVGKANLDDLLARESSLREQVSAAEAEAHAAQADVGTYGVGLKDRVIVTPISGRVVTKPATVGSFVGGVGNPDPIAEIVDFTSLMVETDVPEARLHLVKIGGPAEVVLDAYPNKRYRGIAKELGLRVNRQKATVVVKVAFADDTQGVLPEMSARVSFLSKAITDEALKEQPKKVVPAESIADRGGQKVIFTVDTGKLHQFPVKAGETKGGMIELLDGPPPGTKIVAKPNADTADGQRIKESDK
jgi:RND family efflux transporter MFP subunit